MDHLATIPMSASASTKPRYSSATKGVVTIVLLFVLISLLLAGMSYFEGKVFDGVRAYVRGEGLWAKAQKDAVLYLERYTYSRLDEDYLAFEKAIQVNAGDKRARQALQSTPLDMEKTRQAILDGQNDEQDVESLIWFFLNFQHVSYMHDAIAVWTEADGKIDELVATGKQIRAEISSGHPQERRLKSLRGQLKELNAELLVLENRFSSVLGEGARWVKATIERVTLVMLFLLIAAGLAVSRRILRSIATSERQLLISESRFSSLKDSNTIGIASWGVDGRLHDANDLLLDTLGFSRMDLNEGRINWRDLTPEEFRERDELALQELDKFGRCEPYEKSFFNKHGVKVPVYLGASLLQGDKEQGIAFLIDLTERKKNDEALQLADLVYRSITEAVLVADSENRIVAINPAFTELTGYTFDEVRGKDPRILNSGIHGKEFYQSMWDAINKTGAWRGEICNRRKNGDEFIEKISINTIYNENGSVHRRVALFLDVTELKKAEEIIKFHANYDSLTGLPNRRLLHDRLERDIGKSRRTGRPLALLFIDLDHFKEINDRLGHEMGDLLLKEAASRMLSCVRETDTVGRLGGDEFVIILEEVGDKSNTSRIVESLLVKLAQPFTLREEVVSVSASIGIAHFPHDAQDFSALLDIADQAMYEAKRKGRNAFHFAR